MQATLLWASMALLSGAPAVMAKAIITTSSATPTPTPTATSSCTASLVTTLCSYTKPGAAFAVAEDMPGCLQYCHDHPPCDFAIFVQGNPYTGDGTCWLYPGKQFDASKGGSDCGRPYMSVYDKPECAGGSTATATSGACAATASPSAVASVCGYPTPSKDCFHECTASNSAPDCLSQCAKADSCSFVVFNPHNPDNSPYAPGSCWMYPNGTYDAGSASKCSGDPEQFVYENKCPKPKPKSSPPSSSSGTARPTGTGAAEAQGAVQDSSTSSDSVAPTGVSLSHPLAIGAAALLWHGL